MNKRCFAEGMKEIGDFFNVDYPVPSLSKIWEEVREYDDGAMSGAYSLVLRDHLPHHRLPAGRVADIIHTAGKAIRLKVARNREDEWKEEKREEAATVRNIPPLIKEKLQSFLGAW